MISHLEEQSPRCRKVALDTLPRLPPRTLAELDKQDAAECRKLVRAGASRVVAQIPVVRLAGPFLKAAYAAGISHALGLRGPKATGDAQMDDA